MNKHILIVGSENCVVNYPFLLAHELNNRNNLLATTVLDIKGGKGGWRGSNRDFIDADLIVLTGDVPDYTDFMRVLEKEFKGHIVLFAGIFHKRKRDKLIKTISRIVDKALALFRIDETLYKEAGIETEYVGHPFIDLLPYPVDKVKAREYFGYYKKEVPVAILIGGDLGGRNEALRIVMEGAAEAADFSRWKVRMILPSSETLGEDLISDIRKICPQNLKVVQGSVMEALLASDASVTTNKYALAASLAGAPPLILDRCSIVEELTKRFLHGDDIYGLPNILMRKTLLPVLCGRKITSKNVTVELSGLMEGGTSVDEIVNGLKSMRSGLGEAGAIGRAADSILRFIER